VKAEGLSPYLVWAKTESHARFSLASSGVLELPLSELALGPGDLEITGPSYYGYPPLQASLASKLGVEEERVVAATGASMANHLAMAACLSPGDQVLIEEPTYDPIVAVADYLEADVVRFPREPVDRRFDPGRVATAISPRTRLIILTNLHNPTSAHLGEGALQEVGRLAEGVGARVLVDEVYLETLFRPDIGSVAHMGPTFIVTGSLTKAYGLGGLRCGWVIADRETSRRMWRLNDLFGNIPAHAAERLSLLALAQLDRIAARAKALLDRNRRLVGEFLAGRGDLEAQMPEAGTVVFPRLLKGDADRFASLLKRAYDTSVVPGRFFACPDHFRVGFGGRTDLLQAGLGRLGEALDRFGDAALP
jgi:aspartate/methionine/tyrosine aminotransferase